MASFEVETAGRQFGLEDFLDEVRLEVARAGFAEHRVGEPIDCRRESTRYHTLLFVRGARYSLETNQVAVSREIQGAALFRPGTFYAELLEPRSAMVTYIQFYPHLFDSLDLLRVLPLPPLIRLPCPSRALDLCQAAMAEYRSSHPVARMAAHGLFVQSLAWLYREMKNAPPALDNQFASGLFDPIVKAIRLMKRLDGQLRVKQVAEEVGVHPSHLWRLFKKTLGISPHQFIQVLRLRKAKQLLANPLITIEDVSERVGYADTSQRVWA